MSSFKVLQFNMQYGQIWDDKDPDGAPVYLDRTIEEIQSHAADVILLQEVEHAGLDGQQTQPPPNYERLRAALPGYHSYFSYPKSDPKELPFGIGLAIFSRTPLHGTMRHDLPAADITFDFMGKQTSPTARLMIGARTFIEGREVQFFNVHLQAFFMIGSSSQEHPQQRQQVESFLRGSAIPTVLGGDFNVARHDSLVRQFATADYATVQDSEITWRRRPYVLDHLFYSQKFLRPTHHEIKPTPVSDHHTLEADFEFTG